MSSVREEFDGKAAEYESNRLAGWYQAHADEIAKHCPNRREDRTQEVAIQTQTTETIRMG